MKAQDWFGLIIRVVGLILLLYSCWNLSAAIYFIATGRTEFMPYIFYGVPGVIVGILLISLARYIVRFSYHGNRNDSDP
jgi:hypothetical protein